MPNPTAVFGFCDPDFSEVGDEFERNFRERGELGGAVAITVDGRPVVDLWGGIKDQEERAAWEESTLVVVFSVTKGLAAICMHILADQGLIDFDAPVTDYWPEFGTAGKQDVTVAMLLSHQAGIPIWQRPLPPGILHKQAAAASLLAEEAPLWEPGTTHGYHGLTIGWLEAELVRRVTGRSIGTFLREAVAIPLTADIWIGLPRTEHGRVATTYLPEFASTSAFARKLLDDPEWYGTKMLSNCDGDMVPEAINSSQRLSMEHASAGGVATARGLAKAYAPLARDGSVDGVRLVQAAALPGMRMIRAASDCDMMLRLPTSFTLGFSKSWGRRSDGPGNYVIVGENAFGTPGLGGSIGFADGDARMSFGYVMNRHGPGVGLNERGQSLIDAAYRSIGFRSDHGNVWLR